MTKCKNPSCTNEVVSIEGRRPKEFCSVECRTKFHNAKNAKGTGRGRPKGSKNKLKPNANDKIEGENRSNPLINAGRGRDSSGVNEDELRVGEDMICPSTGEHCDDECCPVGAICNLAGSEDGISKPDPPKEPSKWDFSKVVFLNVEDFTEYPKSKCPASVWERTEYLNKKKESDDLIRAAFREYKNKS